MNLIIRYALRMKMDPFIDNAPYNSVCLIIQINTVVLFECTCCVEKPQETSVRQSRDQHLGKRCHHSISKSDDEQGVFLLCQLSNRLASFHWHKIDARKQHMHLDINLHELWSIYRTRSWISALPPFENCGTAMMRVDHPTSATICVQYVMQFCVDALCHAFFFSLCSLEGK